MKPFKKILVPTDFSRGAEKAYPVAQKIASIFGGTVDFIHVIPTVKYWHESMKKVGMPLNKDEDIYPKIISESEHLLKKAMNSYLKDENKGSYFVKIDRKPSETITEHASENNYDMIVIGAKGGDEASVWRGSTTEKVIRSSKVPVFAIDGKLDEQSVENILVPTDTSTLSFTAFPLAVMLAGAFRSELTLLHVLELYGSPSENIPREPGTDEKISLYEGVIERLQEYLQDAGMEHIQIQRTEENFEDQVLVKENGESLTIPLFTKIAKGVSAHYEIELYGEETADLVVMATHGHSGFAHLILGSTAEKIAQYVRKPIITIRPDMKQFNEQARLRKGESAS